MADERAEPVPARPWRPEDGPEPVVTPYSSTDPPALLVWSRRRWRQATVVARQDWADGRVADQGSVDLDGSTTITHRTYFWPQEGMKAVKRPDAAAPRARGEGGGMPRSPERSRPCPPSA